MQKFNTPAPIAAVLEVPAGRIQLIAADGANTTVEVLPADASKGRDDVFLALTGGAGLRCAR